MIKLSKFALPCLYFHKTISPLGDLSHIDVSPGVMVNTIDPIIDFLFKVPTLRKDRGQASAAQAVMGAGTNDPVCARHECCYL